MTAPGHTALLYHDVVDPANRVQTGVQTKGADRYKIASDRFNRHLHQIGAWEGTVRTVDENGPTGEPTCYLTFDDGGVSCAETIAPLLDEHGIKGHFFVICDRIGDEGFLDADQVKSLADSGHHVGSHTVSHTALTTLDAGDCWEELVESKRRLERLVGTCSSLSIPKGAYDSTILETAFEAGYDYVFTSEPTYGLESPGRIGRWNMWHTTDARTVQRILSRNPWTRLRIGGRWRLLQTCRFVLGRERFMRIRERFI